MRAFTTALKELDAGYEVEFAPLPGTQRVFAAKRRSDQQRVVVKRPRGRYPTPEEIAALRHEHSVLCQLKGEPVAQALDLISDASGVALVLAEASGDSADAIVARGLPDIPRLVRLALAATRALAAVHARGVVHRDVKSAHIFLDEASGQAQWIDFGCATQLPQGPGPSLAQHELQGTLAYISPEQTGRTNQPVDRRSDLYSLGVLLYELSTGKRPFVSEDPLELLHAHIARLPAPPSSIRSDLPQAVENIVLRLLAKSPDERYQTADGLAVDLERIQTELTRQGCVTPFELGQDDHDGKLRIPTKLYGRATQRTRLLDAVQRVRQGNRHLTLVTGPAGVGKSALVQQVQSHLVQNGHFVSGKFDQFNRGIPYSALAAACGALVRVYLASSVQDLEAWKQRLTSALGDNARVVIDVVPELALALPEQPQIAPLPPNETRLRFERTFRRFVEASACEGAPVVLFLDDLQWADSASLAVLEAILGSESQGHLLVIGSYRISEVDARHALSLMLKRLEPRVTIDRIELDLLSRDNVLELIHDTLQVTGQSPRPLADLIFEKTSGNPFFVGQFLGRLAAEGYLVYKRGRGFVWNLDAIAALGATDNVVDLIVERLGALPPRAQTLLRLSACIGHTFSLRELSVIAETEPDDALTALTPAVEEGYLLPLGSNHHLLSSLLVAKEPGALEVRYRFAHDRVQQAALSKLDAAERAQVHLRIGRLLLAAAGDAGPNDEMLFEVVTQLDLGREHIAAPEERLKLAHLNLRAALRAKSAAAHESVLERAEICLELLGPEPFTTDYDATLSALFVLAESYYLSQEEDKALELVQTIEHHAKRALDRVPARNLKASIITGRGDPIAATAVCVETLTLLGVSLPDPSDQPALEAAIGAAFGAYQAALGTRDVAALRDLPPMTDAEKLALVNTCAVTIPCAFQWNPSLMVLLVLLSVQAPLEFGTAPISPFFYAQYGIVHNVITGDYARAHEFGLLALELTRRPEHAAARGGVEFVYAAFLSPWVRPRMESVVHFQRGIVAGLDVGDQTHANYCMAVGIAEAFHSGASLSELESQIPGYLKILKDQGDVLNQQLLVVMSRAVACLRSTTASSSSMDDGEFSEERFEREAPPPLKAQYGAAQALLRYMAGDAEGARRVTEAITPPPGVVFKVEYVFYHGMACAQLALSSEPDRRDQLLAAAAADLKQLADWVRVCPRNFQPPHDLLHAEICATRGQDTEALRAYDSAVAAAAKATLLHLRALSLERLGRFQLRAGRNQLAALSLTEARYYYGRWGATSKVQELGKIPGMPSATTFAVEGSSHDATRSSTTLATESGGGNRLDLTSAMRAVNAIASEIRLDPLLQRLMRILVENSGATRGVLVLSERGELKVRAVLRVDPEQVSVDLDEPLETSSAVAASIVRYCARTLEPVVLDDAALDARFAQDPFLKEHHSRSVTCLPLVHQSRLAAVLFLENDTATGAFHAARLERLEFLGGHAAVALQNARLYEELEGARLALEHRVRERTLELTERNKDMRRVLDNVRQGLLTVDIDGRLSSEHSRAATEWLGPLEPQMPFRQYVARVDQQFAENFSFAFEQLVEGLLPEDLLLSQLPSALAHESRHFELSYEPIHVENALGGLLVVIDDVTEARRRAREEAEQQEVLALCRTLSKDRSGVLDFLADAQDMVAKFSAAPSNGVELQRNLHTLKGNAGLFGFQLLAEHCHAAEDAIAGDALEAQHIDAVRDRVLSLRQTLISIAGSDASERVEVSRSALRALARGIEDGLSAGEASRAVEHLLLEPLANPLWRLGDHARALADKLGKGPLRVEVDDGGVLADHSRAAPVFAALVHLARNAVDHGLETPAQRRAAGKGLGVLSLSARADAGEVCITISDNGRGIDWNGVRRRAEELGLPGDSRAALLDALFLPKFTTRDEVTDTSGRGVGLTTVHADVQRLSGRIEIDSEPGAGTEIRVHVPAEALGVRSQQRMATRRTSEAPLTAKHT